MNSCIKLRFIMDDLVFSHSDHFVELHYMTSKSTGMLQNAKFYKHNKNIIRTNGYFHVGWSDFNISQGHKRNPDSVLCTILFLLSNL